MKLAIGNDHAAVDLKNEIIKYLEEKGHEVINFGTDKKESCSYTVYGEAVALAVKNKEVDLGILICGTGVGISLAANQLPGIRAAVCSEPTTARLVREHNDANIIAFGERIVGVEAAKSIVDAFLSAKPEGGRHEMRRELLAELSAKYHK